MIGLSAFRHTNSHRQPIRAAWLLAMLVLGICLGVVAHAYDPRLDEALAALQKAAALVEASSAESYRSALNTSSTTSAARPSPVFRMQWNTSLPPELSRTPMADPTERM